MAYDPVLERDMFRPKSRGVADLQTSSESDDLKSRREQAQAMIDAAKQKFDPSNFQTLTEQDRPGVFRPVAVNMPAAQQTADTAMRMQQMAAQGVRQPVAMAKGGVPGDSTSSLEGYSPYEMSQFLAQHGWANLDKVKFHDYDLPSYNVENIQPTVSPDDTSVGRIQALGSRIRGIGSLQAPMSNLGVPAAEPAAQPTGLEDSPFGGLDISDPTKWTDDQIRNAAEVEARRVARGRPAGTRLGRALQKINPMDIATNADEIEKSLQAERDMAIQSKRTSEGLPKNIQEAQKAKEGVRAIEAATPIPGLTEPSTEEQVTAAQEARTSALAKAERERRGIVDLGVPTPELPAAPSGFGEPTATPAAGGIANLGVPVAEPAAAPSGFDVAKETEKPTEKPTERPAGFDAASTVASMTAPAEGVTTAEQKTAAAPTGTPAVSPVKLPEIGAGSTDMQDIKAERARAREENLNLALIRAGLGIMGGKSSNALVNIGEGAQAGVTQFSEAERVAQEQMRQAKADLREQQRMAQEKAYREATLGMEGQRLGMEQQRIGLTSEAAKENIRQFNETLKLKSKEFQNNIDVAIRKQDESMLTDLHKGIETELTNLENTRTRLNTSQMGIMRAEDLASANKKLDDQESKLRSQLQYLRSNMSERLKLQLPTSSPDFGGFKYVGASKQ